MVLNKVSDISKTFPSSKKTTSNLMFPYGRYPNSSPQFVVEAHSRLPTKDTIFSLLTLAKAQWGDLLAAPTPNFKTCSMITLLSLLTTANAQKPPWRGGVSGHLSPLGAPLHSPVNCQAYSIGIKPHIPALVPTSVRKFDQSLCRQNLPKWYTHIFFFQNQESFL
jgi:hypothetical protein